MDSIFSQAPVTIILIAVTTIVSIAAFSNLSFFRFLALEPFRMKRSGEYHGLATSGFVHANYVHLLLNMYVLFIFGAVLEQTLKSRWFLVVYAASLLTGSIYPFYKYRDDPSYVAIGASGAVSGIVFSYCLFWPLHMLYLFGVVPMPAVIFALLYVAYSVFAMKRVEDNIGHEAHLAGALGGLVATAVIEPQSLAQFGNAISGVLGG